MLRYTGHPIADVGVATIAAFCEKPDPSSLTQEDLLKVAQFLEREYFSGKLLSYLTCVFPNSAYVQPGAQPGAKVKMKPENINRFKRQVLYAFQEPPVTEANGLQCVFSGAPANRIVYRQHVPMITGENVLNFFPAGTGGLPISGPYLLAIQAFPLGARRCYGRALAVHCPDDSQLTYAFARRFLVENRQLLLLAEKSGEKYLDAKAAKTLIVRTLLDIENERRDWREDEPAPSVTVYHLTNSGQGPDINLFSLPSEVVKFIRVASRSGTQQLWRGIEVSAWEKTKTGESGPGISRNYLRRARNSQSVDSRRNSLSRLGEG